MQHCACQTQSTAPSGISLHRSEKRQHFRIARRALASTNDPSLSCATVWAACITCRADLLARCLALSFHDLFPALCRAIGPQQRQGAESGDNVAKRSLQPLTSVISKMSTRTQLLAGIMLLMHSPLRVLGATTPTSLSMQQYMPRYVPKCCSRFERVASKATAFALTVMQSKTADLVRCCLAGY